MDLGLNAKRVVVLGGTRGIGRAIVETFAGEGAALAFCARSSGPVAEFEKLLQNQGGTAHGGALDLSDGDALTAWIAEAASALGGIDYLISNASAMGHGTGRGAWYEGMETDVLGAFSSFHAAAPHLEEAAKTRGDAAFLTIASVSGHYANYPSPYGAMKAALLHLTKGIARSWADKGVRANVISPGTIEFEGGVWGNRKREEPEKYAAALARNPMGRMGTPQEIADATVFLCSPRSRFTSGTTLLVDGAYVEGLHI